MTGNEQNEKQTCGQLVDECKEHKIEIDVLNHNSQFQFAQTQSHETSFVQLTSMRCTTLERDNDDKTLRHFEIEVVNLKTTLK